MASLSTTLAARGGVPDCLLLTGADGYVGRRLARYLGGRFEVAAIGRSGRGGVACDLLDRRAVDALSRRLQPRWIIHAAGNKNVAACERAPRLAYDANVATTLNVLNAWPGVPVLYLSTDYVFDGTRGRYPESAGVAPVTAYGRSKLCAETAGRLLAPGLFTSVRVSALYDDAATFVRFLSTELTAGRPVRCYTNSYYSPTSFNDFAAALALLLESTERPDLIHVAGARISRYDFACEYANACGFDDDLIQPARLDPEETTLYPDLSLSTPVAAAMFGFAPTPHRVALQQMALGDRHDDPGHLPSVHGLTRADSWRDQRRPVGGDQLR